ncbi:class I SAM-dependent methyltransferase [Halanaeroarchaeum sulfurireducens]|uniref:Type 11 methyltransferase n=1 Tax=Halanaeroarchaeum sulfurireducens TaxID=1604004 RepID=A0A0F7P9Y5_9EURY|nr:class I SAM-dependent methyltransferase [Halanaeroarchaeum sulfurireducens]AKH97966.1 type 11 methyltransferase [Halanaeroarchaeum sulfurireducens]
MTGDEDTDPDRRGVVETYDYIAGHFATKRENPWPEAQDFIAGRDVETAIDVGCANGRHTELLADVAERAVGLDASRELLREAVERERDHGFDAGLVQGDALRLPVRTDSVDLAVYVATMHHLPRREDRIGSLDELARVLKPDARGLVSVWSVEHDYFQETRGFDTTVTFTMPDGTEVPRYYHIYDTVEFGEDLAASAVVVEREWVSQGNCYAVVRGADSA